MLLIQFLTWLALSAGSCEHEACLLSIAVTVSLVMQIVFEGESHYLLNFVLCLYAVAPVIFTTLSMARPYRSCQP